MTPTLLPSLPHTHTLSLSLLSLLSLLCPNVSLFPEQLDDIGQFYTRTSSNVLQLFTHLSTSYACYEAVAVSCGFTI